MRKLGFHMWEKLGPALQEASQRGDTIAQVFLGNSMSFWTKPKDSVKGSPIPVVVHGNYPQVAFPTEVEGKKFEFWKRGMCQFFTNVREVNAEYAVIHSGNSGTLQPLMQLIRESGSGPKVLIENSAYKKCPYHNLAELMKAVDSLNSVLREERVGIAYDTAHAWSAGVGLVGVEAWGRHVSLIHLNGHPGAVGSNTDRHSDTPISSVEGVQKDSLICVLKAFPGISAIMERASVLVSATELASGKLLLGESGENA